MRKKYVDDKSRRMACYYRVKGMSEEWILENHPEYFSGEYLEKSNPIIARLLEIERETRSSVEKGEHVIVKIEFLDGKISGVEYMQGVKDRSNFCLISSRMNDQLMELWKKGLLILVMIFCYA